MSRKLAKKIGQKKLAGAVGFEPTIHDTKNRCLTTWPRPSIFALKLQIVTCKYLKVERDYSDQVLADQLKNGAIRRKNDTRYAPAISAPGQPAYLPGQGFLLFVPRCRSFPVFVPGIVLKLYLLSGQNSLTRCRSSRHR